MDIKKHPKRIKDKYNPYTLQIKDDKYILSFVDGEGIRQKMEIDENLYQVFDSFELEDLAYMVKVSRHIEHSVLTENTLNKRALNQPEDIETLVTSNLLNQRVIDAIYSLPNKQSNRMVLFFVYGYSYTEIARMEGCEVSTVMRSIESGIKKIKNNFRINTDG